MLPKYLAAGLTVVVDALVIAIVCLTLALIYWLATGASGEYPRTAADLLFLAGGAVLTFGALIEFFHFKETRAICRVLNYPQRLLGGRDHAQAAINDDGEMEPNAGWTLIFIGILVIASSFLFSLDYII